MRSTLAPAGRGQSSPAISSRNRRAAVIGPIVCELDGPMPILNRSKTERNTLAVSWSFASRTTYRNSHDVSALLKIAAQHLPTLFAPAATLVADRHVETDRSDRAGCGKFGRMGDSLDLSTADLAALAFFLVAWVLHTLASDGKLVSRVSLTTAMNAQREAWMRTMAEREIRIVDTAIMSGLQQGTAFFASSSLIALGGCFALARRVRPGSCGAERPAAWAATPSRAAFQMKVFGLVLILAFSFFKFGWAYRLFNYCSILIGAVPIPHGEAVAQSGHRNGGVACGAHEHAGRQAFQLRPARRVLLDRLSRLVRRPDGVRAVDAAAAGRAGAAPVLLGGAAGGDRSAARRREKADRSGPTANRRKARSIRGSPWSCSAANRPHCRGTGRRLPCPRCGSRPAMERSESRPCRTAPWRAAYGRPRSPAARSRPASASPSCLVKTAFS